MNASTGICLLALIMFLPGISLAQGDTADGSCAPHVAQWLDPASGDILDLEKLFERLSGTRIVLLGEAHTAVAHHRWQLYMLAALHSRHAKLMLGFEMLPRRAQAVLDAWSAGEITPAEFLEQSRWREVWGYDAELYLPLLHFARLNRLPTLALNIDRELVTRVGQQGWAAIEEDQRQGVSDPAPASDAYRESLAQLFAYKQLLGKAAVEQDGAEPPNLEEIKNSDAFANFVDAQLTWDRSMAEALAAGQRRDPQALIVGIVGRGHLEYGYGIPHQLAAMGIEAVDVLLPLDSDDNCAALPVDLASAVFIVDSAGEPRAPARPRLGILIEDGAAGVRVMQVVDDSVAAASGIRKGDEILAAAGFDTPTTSELIAVIQRQAPGTWLPLKLKRGAKIIELVARFPQNFE